MDENKAKVTVSCIIPAAGQGKRMGSKVNKQFLKLQDKPVLTHTWRVFARLSFIEEIILVVSKKEKELCYQQIVLPYKNNQSCKIKVATGGNSRQESVLNGINEVSNDTSFIIVHDGARPLITGDLIECVLKKSIESQAAIAAVPVKDTIKVVWEDDHGKFIKKTPSRDKLWAAQTPQVFEKSIIKKAYIKAMKDKYVAFDDSSLVERIGIEPQIVESSYENIKITTNEDLEIAKKIMKRRGDSCV